MDKETAYGFRTKVKIFIERIERLRKELGKAKRDIRILDIGCGTGRQVTFPLGAQGYSVIGLDMDQASIKVAQKENTFENVQFIHSDSEHFLKHLSKHHFDAIVLSDILEHLSNPEKFLRELHELTAGNAIILVSIPNGFGPFEIENFIFRKTGMLHFAYWIRKKLGKAGSTLQSLNHESGHIQFFSRRNFVQLIERAGYKISFFRRGSFFCGPLTGRIISLSQLLVKWNLSIGKRLPSWMCSVWYFELTNASSSSSSHYIK
ncbi:class I SAM-dependent methyltransferase [Candidatus Peregrinibacteria bacterium]|nr:class I SAM-dependent methyltransferase [Candidatus Peregrinibacteria bacterium]